MTEVVAPQETKDFKVSEDFITKYKDREPPFGFPPLGPITYLRTYARKLDPSSPEDGAKEEWWQTVRRVIEGTYTMQKRWIEQHGLGWNPWKAQYSAQKMFDKVFNLKFSPPGRGLWMAGTEYVMDRGVELGLMNCSFISTESIDKDPTHPFCFLMDVSMLGVGCGFDTNGAGKIEVKGYSADEATSFLIPDSREGWVESVRLLLLHGFKGKENVVFDYSQIRPEGLPIKGFGGTTSGPEPLRTLHDDIRRIMNLNTGATISITTIVDLMNLIGKCVVAGNVRRTAEIALGPSSSSEYLDLKNYEINPDREMFGWTSNNSVFAKVGQEYDEIADRIVMNGEPGLVWLDNIQAYSRMAEYPDGKDYRATGTNPCGEQSLESEECCCLVETFPFRNESLEEYLETIKFAYLYGKTITLAKTHWPGTNRVMLRNRRIGLSMSGIAQFIAARGIDELQRWCEEAYAEIQRLDEEYSNWLAIPRSIKTTSIKPSGTVSLLAGATPGLHYPISRYYIRRIRVSKQSPLLVSLAEAGYKIEPCFGSEDSTVVVEIPIDSGEGVRSVKEVSIWEQLSLAAFMQKHWADNQVSVTVTFDPETESDQIAPALAFFQYQLKAVSFLPRRDKGAYKQMPYEEITEAVFNKLTAELKPVQFSKKGEEAVGEKFCDGDTCTLL